ncbi:MAG: NADH-quinone oxidoreductase subunit M [Actinomycetota bacterium]
MIDHLLTIVTFLPLAGAVVLLLWRGAPDNSARSAAMLTTVVTFIVSLSVLGKFERADAAFQMVERATWVKSIGLQYLVGVDGVSLWMVLLTTFLFPLSVLASWTVEKNVRLYMASMLVLETAVIGSFVALDLLLFFVFFEALLVPMYLIIGGWGGERRIYAAIKFFLYTMAGSAFLLVGILFLFSRSAGPVGHGTFDIQQLMSVAGSLPASTARWLFLAFFVAFAVKVPLFPLHTWLPEAHTEAPTAGSVLLAGVLLKVGAYGLIRFNLLLFPEASKYFAPAVSILAVIGIIYGAVVALIQTDIKRLVAYSSVSHLGFVVLGIFAFTNQGVTGGILQMVNHGLSTGALFLLVGMVYERTHTRDLGRMGGLAVVMPWLTGAFLFAVFSSVGLPGLNNFVGEFLVILGSFAVNRWFGALAAVAVVLAAIYLLWSYQRMAYGPIHEEHSGLPDVNLREVLVLAPVLSLLLVFGVFPKLLTDRIDPTAKAVVAHVSPDHLTDVGAGAVIQANGAAP